MPRAGRREIRKPELTTNALRVSFTTHGASHAKALNKQQRNPKHPLGCASEIARWRAFITLGLGRSHRADPHEGAKFTSRPRANPSPEPGPRGFSDPLGKPQYFRSHRPFCFAAPGLVTQAPGPL
ncbi:hypothetical protein NDU88_006802 [Pleurodeles waltl]|uniref:Uncharacterized protein n=1 Tax=Pleurodeles waltl TaxID=8319 RepID=A0AAV7TY25_PLEWA|nr:hypothetical protein NDU88_006802 [Pleurodeles waltl]